MHSTLRGCTMAFRIHHLVAFLCGVVFIAYGYCFTIEKLPPDKSSARMLVSRGEIDSAFWELIEPLYDNPLDIATGELAILYDRFPFLKEHMPDEADLMHYQPWTLANQQRLFRDYPVLISFQPVLTFSSWSNSKVAMIRVDTKLRPSTDKTTQRVRFNISHKNKISAKGTIKLDHQTARWQRRVVCLDISDRLSIQTGNIRGTDVISLAYGRFGKDSTLQENRRSNWLYGTASTWNGLYARVPFSSGFRIEGIAHDRPTERIVFLNTKIPVRRWCELTPGVSWHRLAEDFVTADNNHPGDSRSERALGAHLGVHCEIGSFKLALHGDMMDTQPGIIPVMGTLSFHRRRSRASVRIIHFPQDIYLPLSREYKWISGRVSALENKALTQVEVMPVFMLWERIDIRAHYRLIQSTDRYRFDLTNKISCRQPLKLTLSYRCKAYQQDIAHDISLRHSKVVNKEVQYSITPAIRIIEDTLAGADVEAEMKVNLLSILCASADVLFRKKFGMYTYTRAGMTLRMDLFEKTFGTCRICAIFEDSRYEGVEFNAQTSFCF